jgi:type IV pilus assembly protein PilO
MNTRPGKSCLKTPLLIALILLVAGYLLVLKNPLESLEQLEREEISLRHEFEKVHAQRTMSHLLIPQLDQVRRTLAELSRAFPDQFDQVQRRGDLFGSADAYRLRVSRLTFGDPVAHDFYLEHPFRLEAEGKFDDLYYFLYDVFYVPKAAVSLGNFVMRRSPVPGRLLLTQEGSFFQYASGADR